MFFTSNQFCNIYLFHGKLMKLLKNCKFGCQTYKKLTDSIYLNTTFYDKIMIIEAQHIFVNNIILGAILLLRS